MNVSDAIDLLRNRRRYTYNGDNGPEYQYIELTENEPKEIADIIESQEQVVLLSYQLYAFLTEPNGYKGVNYCKFCDVLKEYRKSITEMEMMIK